MLDVGGNIYFLVEDLCHRRPQLPSGGEHDDRVLSVEQYQAMMLAGGRSRRRVGAAVKRGDFLTWLASPLA